METPVPARIACARCEAPLIPGQGNLYVVKILAVADPHPPVFAEEDLMQDPRSEIQQLLAELWGKTEDQLIDQVYRRELFHLCASCYRRWMADPFQG